MSLNLVSPRWLSRLGLTASNGAGEQRNVSAFLGQRHRPWTPRLKVKTPLQAPVSFSEDGAGDQAQGIWPVMSHSLEWFPGILMLPSCVILNMLPNHLMPQLFLLLNMIVIESTSWSFRIKLDPGKVALYGIGQYDQ